LHLFDKNFDKIVEPGDFTIMLGSSSRNEDLNEIQLAVVDE
jgi:hypothetical protein